MCGLASAILARAVALSYPLLMPPGAWFVALAELAVFLAAAQYLLGEAAIFDRPRARLPLVIRQLLACPACCGFWLGLAFGAAAVGPWVDGPAWWNALRSGFAAVAITPFMRGVMALGWAAATTDAGHDHEHEHEGALATAPAPEPLPPSPSVRGIAVQPL